MGCMILQLNPIRLNLEEDDVRGYLYSYNGNKKTFSEYLNYEEGMDNPYELVDGKLVLVNLPAKMHFKITRFLVRLFEDEILH